MNPHHGKKRFRRLYLFVTVSCLVLLAGVTLFGLFARQGMGGEGAVSLRWQYGLLGIAVGLLLAAGRSYRFAALSVLLAGFHLWPAFHLYTGRIGPASAGMELKVASVNLWTRNHDEQAFRKWLLAEKPGLAAVLEVSPFWEEVLDALRADYPHQLLIEAKPPAWTRESWKIGLISRYPIEGWERFPMGDHAIPYLIVDVRVEDRLLQTVVLHAMPPRTQLGWIMRNRILEEIAGKTRWRDPAVVLGDFNATLYSPVLSDFLAAAGLRDTREGFGRMASWVPLEALPFLSLDLDHILVRPGIGVIDRGVGPHIGSDHLPVTATLALP